MHDAACRFWARDRVCCRDNLEVPMSVVNEREIIQIAAAGNCLFALCNDGSLWVRAGQDDPLGWDMVPRVPRRGEEEPPPVTTLDDDADIPF